MTTQVLRPIQAAVLVVAFGWSLLGLSGVAAANHGSPIDALMCGTVITGNTTLTHSVGPCEGDGLIIGANGITLDLGGHTIHGLPQVPQTNLQGGTGAGVLVDDRTKVTIKNGVIKEFDGGVAIRGGGENEVTGITVKDNVGSRVSNWGEGIGLWESNRNTIVGNTVLRNGPYAGIGLYGDLQANGSDDNIVENNAVSDDQVALADQQIGIRVEPYSSDNTISNNTVSGSTLDGIALFFGAQRNTVTDNEVTNNDRDGIRLWWRPYGAANPPRPDQGATNTMVDGNIACGNGQHGVWVGSVDNTISNNTVGKNSPGVVCPANATDVADKTSQPPCANTWTANYYATSDGNPCIGPSL